MYADTVITRATEYKIFPGLMFIFSLIEIIIGQSIANTEVMLGMNWLKRKARRT